MGNVFDGLQYQEQRVVVLLEFRPLMGLHSVFDHQFVQAERVGHPFHLPAVGGVQTHPHVAPSGGAHLVEGVTERAQPRQAFAVDVHRTVDDCT